ncbi:MAG: hypothetical protein JSS02_25105 [Planctomycetes bacterium]|nr:hypothetical protein [Planctomycetota bacterium]
MNSWGDRRFVAWARVACLVGVCLFCATRSPGDEAGLGETSARYYRELRSRGLHRLAESYCLERLARRDLPAAERADLTLELSRTLEDHAERATGSEQEQLWTRAFAVVSDLLASEPDNPRRIVLEVQRACLPASIGHTRRLRSDLEPFDTTLRQRAVETLETAVAALRDIEPRLEAPPAKTKSAHPGSLRPAERKAAQLQVRFRLAVALLDLAHLRVDPAAERKAAVVEAQKLLKGVGESAEDDTLVWRARMEFVQGCLLLDDFARTQRTLDALEQADPPAEFVDRLLALRVRLLLAQKEFRSALALLKQREQAPGIVPGELQALAVEVALADWRSRHPESDARLSP